MWLQVMESPLILLLLLGIFIHNWRSFLSEVMYLHQTLTECVSDWFTYISMLICQCACRSWKVLWFNCVFGNFHILLYIYMFWNVITSSNLYRLCVKAEVYKDEKKTSAIINDYDSLFFFISYGYREGNWCF